MPQSSPPSGKPPLPSNREPRVSLLIGSYLCVRHLLAVPLQEYAFGSPYQFYIPLKNHIAVFRIKLGEVAYSLSSSLMIVLIAMLFGVYDIGLLIAIFFLNATMNLFGLLMEKINQFTQKTDWTSFIFGSIAGIGPWIVVTMYTFGNADLSKVPWFAYAIFASYFFFFNCFPINMILQYKKIGKWKNYLYGERTYIVLSLIAKTVLAWLVFAGVMQPN